MNVNPIPKQSDFSDKNGASRSHVQLLDDLKDGVETLYASGTTANRPNDPVLYQLFFDTTLNSYIYCSAIRVGATPATWVPFGGGGGGTVTSVSGVAPIHVINGSTAPIVSHDVSGVSAGTYGDATHVPVVTFDVDGHATGVTLAVISGGTGTVTSVGLTMPSGYVVTGSPVTGSGTLAVTGPNTTKGDILAFDTANNRFPVSPNDGWAVIADSTQAIGLNYRQLGAVGSDFFYYGDGFDGAVVVSTAIVLARDMYYTNLTVTATGSINTKGWRVHVNGILDLTVAVAGAISWPQTSGTPGLSNTGGGPVTGGVSNTVGGSGGGNSGGTPGSTNVGGAGNPAGGFTNSAGGIGGVGGAGGSGTGGSAAGAGGAVGVITNNTELHMLVHDLFIAMSTGLVTGGLGGAGGGGGTGNGSGFGGGGGGGGAGAGVVALFARTIARSSAGPAGIIACNGAPGGVGFTPVIVGAGAGGGGGGGSGGYLYIVYSYVTGTACTNMAQCNGAAGASGGNGNAGGVGGTGGHGGTSGRIMSFNLGAGVLTEVLTTVAGSPGTGPTGTAGGPGGAGGIASVTI